MRDYILLYINGHRHQVRGSDAFLSLSDYLRTRLGLTGTKIVCSEGDCGACSVLVGRPGPHQMHYAAVDACIYFLFQLDGAHVVSIEGLARDGLLHGAQQAMVDCFGSQCGFCTPGFVIAMAGLLENARAEQRNPTPQEWQHGLTGNLCRCTGYVQILEAAQRCTTAQADGLPTTADLWAELASHRHDSVDCRCEDQRVVLPGSEAELLEVRAAEPAARIVNGATDLGVAWNKGAARPRVLIGLGNLAGADTCEVQDNVLNVGCCVTWAQLERWSADGWSELHRIIRRFGSPQIRNVGTLVGNLVNGSPIGDSVPALYVAPARIVIASQSGRREVDVNQFYTGYRQVDLAADEIVTQVAVPLPAADCFCKLYKVSRRYDMDIASFTAAVHLQMDGERIRSARIAYGGVAPTVVRLPATEAYLTGQTLTEDVMRLAGREARNEITPISDVRGRADYRFTLAENILVKCFHDYVEDSGAVTAP